MEINGTKEPMKLDEAPNGPEQLLRMVTRTIACHSLSSLVLAVATPRYRGVMFGPWGGSFSWHLPLWETSDLNQGIPRSQGMSR